MVIVLLLITVIILASVLGAEIRRKKTTSYTEQNVCLSSACIQASAQVLAALNQSIDPCEDFYEFACGSWLSTNIVPSGEMLFSQYSMQNCKYNSLPSL